jgi:hypothetical protein
MVIRAIFCPSTTSARLESTTSTAVLKQQKRPAQKQNVMKTLGQKDSVCRDSRRGSSTRHIALPKRSDLAVSNSSCTRRRTVKLQDAGSTMATVMGAVGLDDLAVCAPSRSDNNWRRRARYARSGSYWGCERGLESCVGRCRWHGVHGLRGWGRGG